MSFGEHLEELRRRILRAMFGSLFGVALCIIFYKVIVAIVVRPYKLAATTHGLPDNLLTNKPQEAFLTTITLAFEAGLVLASPWIIYQLWQFVAAGLYPRERKIVYRYTGPSAVLFLLGVAFFYFIVLPMTLNFFMGFATESAGGTPTPNIIERFMGIGIPSPGPSTRPASTQSATGPATTSAPATRPLTIPVLQGDPEAPPDGSVYLYYDSLDRRIKMRSGERIEDLLVTAHGAMFMTTWRYDDYLSFVTFTALVFGIAFELPMVILVLAQTGIVETQTFRNVRKYAYFGILIGAVVAAPAGDLMTLFFLTVPLIGLYELGIVAAAMAIRRQKAREAEEG